MIYYFNKGLILEQEIVKAIKSYFSSLRLSDDYKNYSINITNEHPFDTLISNGETQSASLFPAIIVTTYEDVKPPQLNQLTSTQSWTLEKSDIDEIIPSGYDVVPEVVEEIREIMKERDHLYGACFFMYRQDRISIEIWSENIRLKNELYEKVRLFVCGMMKHLLQERYKSIANFDDSIQGQRSNNFNYNFGVSLAGAQITFEVDYIIEQSIIDTELAGVNGDFLLEVINHVKEYTETTREWIYGPDSAAGAGGSAGTSSAGGNGNAG
jgi:hypothetical protein